MPRRQTPRIWRRRAGRRHRMRGERVRSAQRLPPAKPTQGKQQQRIPNVTTFFKAPFVRDQAAPPSRFPRGNMHLSARSELKTELAESRIETKLPICEAGLLHVCLTEVSDSHAGALMLVMQEGPRCVCSARIHARPNTGPTLTPFAPNSTRFSLKPRGTEAAMGAEEGPALPNHLSADDQLAARARRRATAL
jgi:hypothetical protein